MINSYKNLDTDKTITVRISAIQMVEEVHSDPGQNVCVITVSGRRIRVDQSHYTVGLDMEVFEMREREKVDG